MKDQSGYLNGIAVPIDEPSYIVHHLFILECSNFALVLFHLLNQIARAFQVCVLDYQP